MWQLLCDTLVQHFYVTLLYDTLVWHSVTLFCDSLVLHYVTFLCDTLMSHSCASLFKPLVWQSCVTLLCDTVVWHSVNLLHDNLISCRKSHSNSCVTLLLWASWRSVYVSTSTARWSSVRRTCLSSVRRSMTRTSPSVFRLWRRCTLTSALVRTSCVHMRQSSELTFCSWTLTRMTVSGMKFCLCVCVITLFHCCESRHVF